MKRNLNLLMYVLFVSVCSAAENEYFPLIENSTYTYHGVFNSKTGVVTSDITWVVKAEKRQETSFYFFLNQKDERNPNADIGSNGIGRGLYSSVDGNIGAIECGLKTAINATPLKDWTIILKNPPEVGQNAERKIPAETLTWKVEGFEDVTVPAGTFKKCVKIKTEEIVPERKRPEFRLPNGEVVPATTEPEKRYSGYAWLAKGVGMVKWQRHTGRVDELTGFKLSERK